MIEYKQVTENKNKTGRHNVISYKFIPFKPIIMHYLAIIKEIFSHLWCFYPTGDRG